MKYRQRSKVYAHFVEIPDEFWNSILNLIDDSYDINTADGYGIPKIVYSIKNRINKKTINVCYLHIYSCNSSRFAATRYGRAS